MVFFFALPAGIKHPSVLHIKDAVQVMVDYEKAIIFPSGPFDSLNGKLNMSYETL